MLETATVIDETVEQAAAYLASGVAFGWPTGLTDWERDAYREKARTVLAIAGVSQMRDELAAYHAGVGGLAIDEPGLRSPRIEGCTSGGAYAIYLQQTHLGVPVWVCGSCVQLTVAETNPGRCAGCGGEDFLSEALHSDVRFEDESEIAATYGETSG